MVLNIRMLHWLKLLLLMIVGVRYYSPLLLSLVIVATGNRGDFLSQVGSSTTDDIWGNEIQLLNVFLKIQKYSCDMMSHYLM